MAAISFMMAILAISNSANHGDKELVARLTTAHRAAREAIVAVHCNVEQKSTEKASPLNLQAEFWKVPEGYRLKVSRSPTGSFPDIRVDSSYLNGHFQQLVTRKRGGREETVLVKLDKKTYQDFGNPWFFGLLTFIGPNDLGPFTLEELLENKDISLDSVKTDKTPNGESIVLRLTHKNGYFVLTFDGRYNYLVRQAEYSVASGKIRSIHTVHSFKELGRGVYFPDSIVLKNEVNGQVRETVTTTVKILEPDKRLGPEVIALTIPAGIRCHDNINNQRYAVDSSGNRVGPLLDDSGRPIAAATTDMPTSSESPKQTSPSTQMTQTREEPSSWTAWLLPVSVLILLSAAGLYGFRRFRAAT